VPIYVTDVRSTNEIRRKALNALIICRSRTHNVGKREHKQKVIAFSGLSFTEVTIAALVGHAKVLVTIKYIHTLDTAIQWNR
jgi:hypothetical protein